MKAVFSFLDEQRRFLLILMGFLTFLTIASMGVMLSMSTAVGRFSGNLAKTGVMMIMPGEGAEAARKILDANADKVVRTKIIDKAEGAKLLGNWLKSANVLGNYIPQMIEIRAKTAGGLAIMAAEAKMANVRFVLASAATPDRGVGIKIILIAGLVFLMVLGALLICIIHSVRNIVLIHAREIGILNQIGATNNYIARQIQRAMLGLSARAAAAGLGAGALMMTAINGLSRTSKVGLLANMGMTASDWVMTVMLACGIVAITAFATRRTTLRVLAK